jgi:hypothetical protein
MTWNSVQKRLDDVPSKKKVTGVAATVEIVAYPDGHAAIAGHPLNGKDELLTSIDYLWERLAQEANMAND